MKIQQIEIYQSPIKLKEPFITSLGVHDHADNVIVVIRTDEKLTGFGECSPYETINGESMETCFIVGQLLAKGLLGSDPLRIEECHSKMDSIIYGNSSIKSAFDIALYDVASQHVGMPLFGFLGGKNDKQLVTDYTVSIGKPKKMAEDALKIKGSGFRIIKVKVGESKEKDTARISLIRKAIGDDIQLRIDANQGWNVDTAIDTLTDLAQFNIQYCEEPIARWDFMSLSKVKKHSPIPIMADECCCDHHDAKRLVDLEACNMFNIKLGKSSGIFKAEKIIKIAEQAGITLQIGGFIESRLGFTASAHLALTSNNVLHCDFDTPLMFEEDAVVGGITYGAGGTVTVPDAVGLGATIDEGYLQRLKKAIVN